MEIPDDFKPVYHYKMRNGEVTSEKTLDPTLWDEEGVVYLRVHGKDVLYVGKSDGKLSSRIRWHIRNGIPKPRTEPGRRYLEWAKGREITNITILAYKPEPISLFGLQIGVHLGLEAALIREFKPRFNGKGRKTDSQEGD